jgi:SAM-dependent methyltransferase
MRDETLTFLSYLTGSYDCLDPVLEIGACPAQGQVGYSNLRRFFAGKKYVGLDKVKGPGVDVVRDAQQGLEFDNDDFGTVLCIDTLEHVYSPLPVMGEVRRVLKPGGLCVISAPFAFPVHMEEDYWRFTPRCFQDVLLQPFEARRVLFYGPVNYPITVIGMGFCAPQYPFEVDLDYLNPMLPINYPYLFEVWER